MPPCDFKRYCADDSEFPFNDPFNSSNSQKFRAQTFFAVVQDVVVFLLSAFLYKWVIVFMLFIIFILLYFEGISLCYRCLLIIIVYVRHTRCVLHHPYTALVNAYERRLNSDIVYNIVNFESLWLGYYYLLNKWGCLWYLSHLSVLPSSRVRERDAIFTSAKLACTCLNRSLYC